MGEFLHMKTVMGMKDFIVSRTYIGAKCLKSCIEQFVTCQGFFIGDNVKDLSSIPIYFRMQLVYKQCARFKEAVLWNLYSSTTIACKIIGGSFWSHNILDAWCHMSGKH